MEHSLYHTTLRVSALSLACILTFQSGIISPVTRQLADNTTLYLASAISMGASVEPTELNLLTAELTQKQQELAAREAALVEREIAVNRGTTPAASSEWTTYILSILLFLLLVLIVLNYFLDYWRATASRQYETVA